MIHWRTGRGINLSWSASTDCCLSVGPSVGRSLGSWLGCLLDSSTSGIVAGLDRRLLCPSIGPSISRCQVALSLSTRLHEISLETSTQRFGTTIRTFARNLPALLDYNRIALKYLLRSSKALCRCFSRTAGSLLCMAPTRHPGQPAPVRMTA